MNISLRLVLILLSGFLLVNCGGSSKKTKAVEPRPFKIKIQPAYSTGYDPYEFIMRTQGASYNYNIDCNNDGTFEATNVKADFTCHYTEWKPYIISISGTFPQIDFSQYCHVLSIEQWGTGKWHSMKNAFSSCSELKINASDTPDLSQVKDMSHMFSQNRFSFQPDIDISTWDVSNVTNMKGLFLGGITTDNYNRLLNSWSKLTLQKNVELDITDTVYGSTSEKARAKIISNFNWKIYDGGPTVKTSDAFVIHIQAKDSKFEIPTQGLGYSYDVDCDSNGKLEETNVTGNYTCHYKLAGNYSISITGIFPHIYFNSENNNNKEAKKVLWIKQWGTGKWRSMENAFAGCKNLRLNAQDKPDLSQVENLSHMFDLAIYFNQDIGNWDVSNITNMSYMFADAWGFNQNIGSWDVSNVTNMSGIFRGATGFNQDIGRWDVGNVTDMSEILMGAAVFNQDLGAWDVSNVTNMSRMFRDAMGFYKSIETWDVSSVTNMEEMFFYVFNFNQNLGSWNVSNVKNMKDMLLGTEALSTNNYDSLLNGWSKLALQNNVSFGAGTTQYSSASATAREKIISDYNWTIDDGGLEQ